MLRRTIPPLQVKHQKQWEEEQKKLAEKKLEGLPEKPEKPEKKVKKEVKKKVERTIKGKKK